MDVPPWIRIAATDLCEKGLALPVLIEPSLGDSRTTSCFIDRAPKPRAADAKLSEVSQ